MELTSIPNRNQVSEDFGNFDNDTVTNDTCAVTVDNLINEKSDHNKTFPKDKIKVKLSRDTLECYFLSLRSIIGPGLLSMPYMQSLFGSIPSA